MYHHYFCYTKLPIQGACGTPGEVYNEGLCCSVTSNKCCMLLQIKQKILENLEEIDAYFFFFLTITRIIC